MVSWPGTAATVICMLTLRSRSVNGLTQISPGSGMRGSARPQRKTTPRSYWRMISNPNIPAIPSPPGANPTGSQDPDGAGAAADAGIPPGPHSSSHAKTGTFAPPRCAGAIARRP